jgi:hypothetical protein
MVHARDAPAHQRTTFMISTGRDAATGGTARKDGQA